MNGLKLSLYPSPTERNALFDTMEAFNEARNIVLEEARLNDCFNKHKLSKLFYHQIKNDFLLPSQLAVCTITTVVEDYKRNKLPMQYEKFSDVFYDKRVISFKGLYIASIATTIGRVPIKFTFDEYFSWVDAPKQKDSAILTYQSQPNTFHLSVVIA